MSAAPHAPKQQRHRYDSEEDPDDSRGVEEQQRKPPAAVLSMAVSMQRHDQSPPASQVSFSQEEDEHIRKLERSGALSHVVGSQSLLSQEIQDMSQRPTADDTPVHASSLLTQECLPEEEEADREPDITSSQLSYLAHPEEEVDREPDISSSQLSYLAQVAQELHSQEKQQRAKEEEAQLLCPESMSEDEDEETELQSQQSTTSLLAMNTSATSTLPKTRKERKHKQIERKTKQKKRKLERDEQQSQARQLAQQAASLAAQAISSPEVSKQLLLSMVFVRTNPRSPPASWPMRGAVIKEGFFWGTFPPLESVLKRYMRHYYDLSTKKCQSKEQQAFNNDMVTIVRREAAAYEWTFSPAFTDKLLRDRIRCYFKTHIQNAKKRLRTMLMNPTKKANTKALIQHLDLITTTAKQAEDEAGNDGNEKTTKRKRKKRKKAPAATRESSVAVAENAAGGDEATQDEEASQEEAAARDAAQEAAQQVVRSAVTCCSVLYWIVL